VLARGATRSGKAVIYVPANPLAITHAQIVQRNLRSIGIDVEVRPIPGSAYIARLSTRGEPYDIAALGWLPDYVDPYAYINALLDGRQIPAPNASRFDSPRYNRLMRRAARLRGEARYGAYGRLDVRLARDAAPLVPVAFSAEPTLVSRRVDPRCIVLRPTLVLNAVCLKRGS
jgi:dipeptide transport system substrate-binding protein